MAQAKPQNRGARGSFLGPVPNAIYEYGFYFPYFNKGQRVRVIIDYGRSYMQTWEGEVTHVAQYELSIMPDDKKYCGGGQNGEWIIWNDSEDWIEHVIATGATLNYPPSGSIAPGAAQTTYDQCTKSFDRHGNHVMGLSPETIDHTAYDDFMRGLDWSVYD